MYQVVCIYALRSLALKKLDLSAAHDRWRSRLEATSKSKLTT